MPDRKKVIRMLSNTLRHCHNLYNKVESKEQSWLAEINEGAKEAIELLKEQEPVKPLIGGNQSVDGCWWYICPKCRFSIDKGDCFCRHCGRKVEWD